ncbi:putative quinol monooxygenase [Clostridium sp. E02]|uniref:putative quinol monooxygenase n=1 Tax=Clostridium sp. E02 TaxID=2487134 RepID=UPI000F54ADF0|nr:putative quinol monooxygenase [Clostridium sp. E02]
MIKVVAKNYVKEGKKEEFLEIARKLVQETRANDTGCIRYELVQDVKDPLVLTMLEEWEDQTALGNHGATAHFKKAIKAMSGLVEKPGETNMYTTLI